MESHRVRHDWSDLAVAAALWKDLYKMKPSVYVQAILPFEYLFIHFQSQHIFPISYSERSFQCISNVVRFCCIVCSVLWLSYTLNNYTWVDCLIPWAIQIDECRQTHSDRVHPKASQGILQPSSADDLLIIYVALLFLECHKWGHTVCCFSRLYSFTEWYAHEI